MPVGRVAGLARPQWFVDLGTTLHGAHESEAGVDQECRVGRACGPDGPTSCAQRRARKVLPRLPVMQQRVRLLSGEVDVDATAATFYRLLRENAVQLNTHTGDGQIHSNRLVIQRGHSFAPRQ